MRIIEDFLARSGCGKCTDLRDVAEKLQAAFKLYLNVAPTVTSWSPASDEFSLVFESNPIAEFVELPDNYANLKYSNILCGAIRFTYLLADLKKQTFPFRGALEMVHLEVAAWYAQDSLKGIFRTKIADVYYCNLPNFLPQLFDQKSFFLPPLHL